MYKWMNSNRIEGLEIAPTRIFPENPYDRIKEAKDWADNLREEWNLRISSMQSIWYGRKENIFASKDERETLIDYTKRSIDFAKAILSGDDKDMSTAQKKIITRLLLAGALFILPFLTTFLLDLFGLTSSGVCGMN